MTLWTIGTILESCNEQIMCHELSSMSIADLVHNYCALASTVDAGLQCGDMPYSAQIALDIANVYLIELGLRCLYTQERTELLKMDLLKQHEFVKCEEYVTHENRSATKNEEALHPAGINTQEQL